jgi:hypothetical protein
MKIKIVQIILLIVIGFLGYQLWETIQEPVRFNKEKDRRASVVVQNLKDIRTVQQVYRSLHDSFAPNFDTLNKFMIEGEIPLINIIFDPSDTTLVKTISDTLGYVNVADSLFGRRENFKVTDLQYIPFSGGEKFFMEADKINKGGVLIPVFMVMAKKEQYLKGLPENQIRNKQVKDLIVGSLEEPTTDGNWE